MNKILPCALTLLSIAVFPTATNGQCGTPPRLIGDWETLKSYPLTVLEAQGAIIGDDFVVISGFTNGVSSATNHNYALDLTNPNANWRRVADLPVRQGITHGAFAVVGTKLYM